MFTFRKSYLKIYPKGGKTFNFSTMFYSWNVEMSQDHLMQKCMEAIKD